MTFKEMVKITEASKKEIVVLTCDKGVFSYSKVQDLPEFKKLAKQVEKQQEMINIIEQYLKKKGGKR